MIRRSILEWERLDYGECDQTIPEPVAGRLAAVARTSIFAGAGGAGVLHHGRKDIRARGIIGVVAASGAQLEILPKIESRNADDATDKTVLRHRLVHMLAVARDIRIDTGSLANLGWQRDTLLEILIRFFCRKLSEAVRGGMPRRYINCEDDLSTLRGRLDLQRQFTVLAASPQRLACRFDTLSPDIAINHAMKATVALLSRHAQAPDNQRALRELAFVYADITDIQPAAIRWDAIVLDRTNQRWRELLALARLLVGRRFQQTSAGSAAGHALLFEMNVLFEEYVGRLLKRVLKGTDLTVTMQGGHRDCLFEGETGRFRTKPDLIVRRGQKPVLILDTKWKRMSPRIDDPKRGVSQSDIYQLMAYSQLYDCPRVALLYPYHHGLESAGNHHNYTIGERNGARMLTVATVDVGSGIAKSSADLADLVDRLVGLLRATEPATQPSLHDEAI